MIPTTPNENYFKHVDYIIDKAAEEGLVIGLLPTWGDKVTKSWGWVPLFLIRKMHGFMADGSGTGIKTIKILYGYWVVTETRKTKPN